jgi:hypothetical protein
MDAIPMHSGEDRQQESAFLARLRPGLDRLLVACQLARDVGRDPWDFAVELNAIRESGLEWNEVRWLVCKGYVVHAKEITLPGDSKRVFRPEAELVFHRRTCLVLTDEGSAFARLVRQRDRNSPSQTGNGDGDVGGTPTNGSGDARGDSPLPSWDPERRELRVAGSLVKRFRVPSPNQERIIAVFEEEGWPPRIDDPLPPLPELDSKSRLRDTIKSLNRHQVNRLLHITGDGTGQGIRWQILEGDHASVASVGSSG